LFSFVLVLGSKISYADYTAYDPCDVELATYNRSLALFSLDIRRTVDNVFVSTLVSLLANLMGVNPDLIKGCELFMYEKIAEGNYGTLSERINEVIENNRQAGSLCEKPTEELAYCESLLNDYSSTESGSGVSSKNDIRTMAVNSSFYGMANSLEGFIVKEPLPVNLAYAWDRAVYKIPVVGTTLAANNASEAYENLPVLKAVYNVWVTSRSVALALMSVVLMYTGIMIILRKKVNQQLVVSVQYAIPKIIIGAALIIFSYPIGAVITSISWGLFRGGSSLFNNLIYGGSDVLPSGVLSLALINLTLGMAKGGAGYIVVAFVAAIILWVARLVIYLKAFMLYIKMAASVVSAPIEFVVGTIPGSDSRILDWFKRMGKYLVTLFGMGIVIPATMFVALEVMLAYVGNNMEVGGWGVIFALFAPLVVATFGFSFGISIESKVDALFGGTAGKKK